MKKIFAYILLAIGIIGGIWLFIRVTFIDWYLRSQSFVADINPFTHIKAFLFLLKDPDIYVIAFCGWLGWKLLNSSTKDDK